MKLACIHSSNPFIDLSSLRRVTNSPYIYTPWCSLGWNFLQSFENVMQYGSLLMLWDLMVHMSLWVQFAQFFWMFEISPGTMQEGEIRFGSPAVGWEGLILVKTRLLLKSLHNEVLCVFTGAVNSLPASYFLHCLSSYTYIDGTL